MAYYSRYFTRLFIGAIFKMDVDIFQNCQSTAQRFPYLASFQWDVVVGLHGLVLIKYQLCLRQTGICSLAFAAA